MLRHVRSHSRRRFLGGLSLGAAAITLPSIAWADDLARTPAQGEGPFYPNKLPLDTDNDLLCMNAEITPAVGEVTHLSGRVLSTAGTPLRNVVVEIWQVDNNGIYLHTDCPNRAKRDEHFQGFGRFLTGSSGEYYFRTIKPVPYSAGITRTPHIHFIVKRGDRELLATQMYVKDHPLNAQDSVLRHAKSAEERALLMVDYQPLAGSKSGELTARFDLVLGVTPEDSHEA